MEYNSALLLLITNLLLCKTHVYFGGFFTQFWDYFHLYVNGRFFLEEIWEMLIRKTYVNEAFTLMGVTFMIGLYECLLYKP